MHSSTEKYSNEACADRAVVQAEQQRRLRIKVKREHTVGLDAARKNFSQSNPITSSYSKKGFKLSRGFTLLEMIITITIASTLFTLVVPGFQVAIRENRLINQANEFIGTLNLARSEAIKRGVRVTVCKSFDKTNCSTTGGFEQGWIIFVDLGNPTIYDAGIDSIIRVSETMPAGMTLVGDSAVVDYVSFTGDGLPKHSNNTFRAGQFKLCQSREGIQINVSLLGRAQVKSKFTTKDTLC